MTLFSSLFWKVVSFIGRLNLKVSRQLKLTAAYLSAGRWKRPEILGTLALAMCKVRPTDIRGMDCGDD